MEFEGTTEQEAVERASVALSVGRAQLDYTVIDEGSGGLLGFGARPVRIRARAAGSGEDAPAGGRARRGGEEDDEAAGGIVGPAPEKAEKAREVAQSLVDKMAMAARVTVRDDHREIVVTIEEEEGKTDVADMLGSSRPPGVPSFQFLLNKIVNRFPENRKHIVVEAPSVAAKHAERKAQAALGRPPRPEGEAAPRREPPPLPEDVDPAMVVLAEMLAQRVKALGKVLTIHPMAAQDRRAIHLAIDRLEGVSTVSEGEGLYRRIHIVPKATKDGGGGRKRRRRRRRRRGGGGSENQAGAPADAE